MNKKIKDGHTKTICKHKTGKHVSGKWQREKGGIIFTEAATREDLMGVGVGRITRTWVCLEYGDASIRVMDNGIGKINRSDSHHY